MIATRILPRALIVLACSVPVHAALATCVDYSAHLHWVSRVTHSNGSCVASQDQYVYFGTETDGVFAVDVSEANSPLIVGKVRTPGIPTGIAVQGSYGYVADYSGGLCVLDIADPAHPQALGSAWSMTSISVAVKGSYAYMTDFVMYRLFVVDVTDPMEPWIVADIRTPSFAWGVALSGEYAYVTATEAGLVVVDVSNPSHPVAVANLPLGGVAFGIAVAGSYAYITNAPAGLQIVDIADPTHPTLVAELPMPGTAMDVALNGGYALLAVGDELQCVDVRDPTHPVGLGGIGTRGASIRVHYGNGLAHAVAEHEGLMIFDANPSGVVQLTGGVDTPGMHCNDVGVRDDYAFLADTDRGMSVVDIRDPSHPILVGNLDTPGTAQAVDFVGPHVCLGDGSSGVRILDVTDPSTPVEIGHVDTPDYVFGVAATGNLILAADWATGLIIIDASDPTTPRIIGSVDTSPGEGRAMQVVVDGTLAYVADQSTGLVIVDFSQPDAPRIVGGYPLPGRTSGVAYSPDLAYLVGDDDHYFAIDVTDPTSPRLVGERELLFSLVSIVLSNHLAYVSAQSRGVLVLDISDPSAPICIGNVETPGDAKGIQLEGRHLFVADLGLRIAPAHCPMRPFGVPRVRTTARFGEAVVRSLTVGPNPSAGSLKLHFDLTRSGRARVEIVDVTGRRVRVLLDEVLRTGPHLRVWDGRDDHDRRVPAGVYLVRLRTDGGACRTERLILTR